MSTIKNLCVCVALCSFAFAVFSSVASAQNNKQEVLSAGTPSVPTYFNAATIGNDAPPLTQPEYVLWGMLDALVEQRPSSTMPPMSAQQVTEYMSTGLMRFITLGIRVVTEIERVLPSVPEAHQPMMWRMQLVAIAYVHDAILQMPMPRELEGNQAGQDQLRAFMCPVVQPVMQLASLAMSRTRRANDEVAPRWSRMVDAMEPIFAATRNRCEASQTQQASAAQQTQTEMSSKPKAQ